MQRNGPETNETKTILTNLVRPLFCTALLLLFLQQPLHSQIALDDEPLGVQYSILPVFGYNSDLGFLGGGLFQRVDYGKGVQPFRSSTTIDLIASVKGAVSGTVDHEELDLFHSGFRGRFRFQGIRLLYAPWFGIGNETTFSRSAYEEGFYFFDDRSLLLDFWARRMILEREGRPLLEGQLLFSASWHHPVTRGGETLYALQFPDESDRGWVSQAGVGLIMDRRDHEFNPSRGFRIEMNRKWSGKLTGSEFPFSTFSVEARHYFSPFRNLRVFMPLRNLVVAQKLEIRTSSGETPVWHLPVIGNEDGLRGYIHDRFRGESSVLHILELRSWLFDILDGQIRFGGQLFMDSGRVFAGSDRLLDLPSGVKQTFGIGGAISFLNPDFIFRGELAFSNEINRIYLGIGYLF